MSRISDMAACVCVCVHMYGLNAVVSDVTKAMRREGRSRAAQDSANDRFRKTGRNKDMVMKTWLKNQVQQE